MWSSSLPVFLYLWTFVMFRYTCLHNSEQVFSGMMGKIKPFQPVHEQQMQMILFRNPSSLNICLKNNNNKKKVNHIFVSFYNSYHVDVKLRLFQCSKCSSKYIIQVLQGIWCMWHIHKKTNTYCESKGTESFNVVLSL